jgi:hypothetical protein
VGVVEGSSAPAGATKQERIDFLRQVVAFTEGNVRSYDTKAQISLAAFVLSANPLVAIAGAGCSVAGAKSVLMLLVPAYIATIVTYLWVLWPVAPPIEKLTEGLKTQNIFFIHDPIAMGSAAFVGKLAQLQMEPELTAEALKLAHIRRVKAARFKVSLLATLACYALIAIAFFAIGRCF